MTISVPERHPSPITVRSVQPHWYTMFGLPVRSEVRLPLPPLAEADPARAAWSITCAEPGRAAPEPDGPLVTSVECPVHGVEGTVHRGPSGGLFWRRAVGTVHVMPAARLVKVYPEADIDERALHLV